MYTKNNQNRNRITSRCQHDTSLLKTNRGGTTRAISQYSEANKKYMHDYDETKKISIMSKS